MLCEPVLRSDPLWKDIPLHPGIGETGGQPAAGLLSLRCRWPRLDHRLDHHGDGDRRRETNPARTKLRVGRRSNLRHAIEYAARTFLDARQH